MTAHSGRGQGDPPLYEGVVLPANGDPWTPEQQRQVDQSHGKPPSGQPWGQPWGPESQAAVASGEPAPPSLPSPPQAPPEQPPLIPHQQQHALQGESGIPDAAPGGRHRVGEPSPPSSPPASDLPPAAPAPDPHGGHDFYGNGQLPQQAPHSEPQLQQQPQQQMQAQQPHMHQPQQPPQQPPQPQQPPAGPSFAPGGDAAQMFPSGQGASASDATQYIPPVAADAPQPGPYQQGQAPVGEADATQMLPPQTGQAPVHDPESTAQLRTPLPPEAPAGGHGGQGGPQNGQPQPPAGFESLFRSESPSGSGEPGSTQSLPLFDQAVARQRSVGDLGKSGGPAGPGPGGPGGPGGAYGQNGGAGQAASQPAQWEPQGRAARRNAERSAVSRISPGVLIAVGVAVVAGVGMVAGAALTGGEEEKPKADDKSSAAPASERSAGPDPAEAQAKELDKLLADSNNSRASVISSVENIKSCKKLGQAARDLRSAAGQRNGLVARLGKLQTDQVAAEGQLKSALTRAWKASASADNHYAAWADQTAGKKGCRKGKARTTGHVGLGARASGEATTAKKQAAGLWNPTAKKYGLKQRQVGEL